MAKKSRSDQELLESLYNLLSAAALGALTDAYVNNDWRTSDTVFSETFLVHYLPEMVRNLAVLFGKVPHSFTTDDAARRLTKSIDTFRSELIDTHVMLKPDNFRTPNPFNTITDFCRKNRLNPTTTFIKLVAPQADRSVCMTTQRRVIRLTHVPDVRKLKVPNESQRSFSMHLRNVMAAHDAKRFGSLPVDDLLWLPKPEEAS